ncbi:hypothetical protein HETIRDRAFT_318964 [Heterobasidion irregulare TC 32-1]|uniref:Cryptic loci regulator 2 N-terminal domain-containing protein n=1 Tax=Heterobasidion irregulare (strain TC 32-1) TaxID=747525 RepID=W4K6B8_HETIT|nr:uncharacterized protein HETIRDRAFT_318964 [Heterobasidion irregulare TC 32-1]ETW81343.1 hypothetical protein HETIRDRAFT_318964 [Heterobasidion irregulare TC 32-1]
MPPSTLEWVERVRRVNRLGASHAGQGPSLLNRAPAHAPMSLTTRLPIVPPRTHNVKEGAFTIDNNIINIHVSDGDESRRPPPDHCENAKFSVFKPVALDDKVSVRWRRSIGRYLAVETLKKDLNAKEPVWTLKQFPKGYALYDHQTGRILEKKNPRHDFYLYGHTQRFRSPEEFVLHVEWLMCNMPLKSNGHPNCRCKYCGKTKQLDINAKLLRKRVSIHNNNHNLGERRRR